MTEVNIPLLRKAVEWAEAEAAKPVGDWFQPLTVVPREEREQLGLGVAEGCGTAYCIAGYIAAITTGLDNPYDSPDLKGRSICDFASEQIGIERDAASALWSMSNTIADVRRVAEQFAGERL